MIQRKRSRVSPTEKKDIWRRPFACYSQTLLSENVEMPERGEPGPSSGVLAGELHPLHSLVKNLLFSLSSWLTAP